MPWQVLTGVVEWWADEGLRDVGRLRFHEASGKPSGGGSVPRGTVDLARAVFAARRRPWRLTEIALAAANDRVMPAIASWADGATVVLTGSPAQPRLAASDETWGDLGVRQMLDTSPLEMLVPKPWPARFHVPGEVLERDISVLPELVSLATDHYEVSYDPELDILTTWAAVIDGAVAQRTTLTHLTVVEASSPAPA